jgi:hypothetical protein
MAPGSAWRMRLDSLAWAALALAAGGCSRSLPSTPIFDDGGSREDAGSAGRDAQAPDAGCVGDECDPDQGWVRRFGGERPVIAAIDADASGDLYLVGASTVMSYTEEGVERWSRHLRGAQLFDVAATRDGFVVAGKFARSVDLGGERLTASDDRPRLFLARFSSAGEHRWSQSFGPVLRDLSARIAVDGDDNLYVTGHVADPIDFGGGPLTGEDFDYDIYLASFRPDGAHRWSSRFANTGLGSLHYVVTGADGNVYLRGAFFGSTDFGGGPLVSPSGMRGYLASFTGAGSHRWSRAIDETSGNLAIDGAGRLYLAGAAVMSYTGDGVPRATWSAGATLVAAGDAGVVVQRGVELKGLTADGEERWSRAFRTFDSWATISDLLVDRGGNAYLAGLIAASADFESGFLSGNGGVIASYAAQGAPRWSHRFGSVWDELHNVAVDEAGNVYLAGTFSTRVDFGGDPLTSGLDGELYLASFSPDGTHRWSRSFGGIGSYRHRHEIEIDGEGNVYLTGIFAGTVDFGGGPLPELEDPTDNDGQVYVASFTSDGAYRWARVFDFLLRGRGVGAAVGEAGDLVMVGMTPSFLMSLSSYDRDGALRWTREFAGISLDRGATDVAIDARGRPTITGVFYSEVDFGGGPITTERSYAAFVASFDADGAHRWSHRIGESAEDAGASVAADRDGNVYVAAHFRSFLVFGGSWPVPRSTTFFAGYDEDGTERWTRRFEGVGGMSEGSSAAVDDDGNAYFAGSYERTVDFGGGALPEAGITDAYVAAYSPDGAHRWSRSFRGLEGTSEAHDIVVANESVYLAGAFEGTVDFEHATLVSETARDIFLLRLVR